MTSNHQENHSLPSEIRFFKIILDTTLQRGNLMIPNKFTREYGGNLSNPVFLKPPDGIEWKVYWTKDDGGRIWFQRGWKEFVTHYSLNHGHLLLFKYQKPCNLGVHILDGTNVEINYPFHDTQNENDNVIHISNDSDEVLDEATLATSSPQPCKKLRRARSSGVVGQSSNLPQHVQITGDQSQEDKGGAIESLTLEQFNSKAATFKAKAPSFTVALHPSYVHGRSLTVPSEYAKKYLKEKQRDDILLRVMDGRTWPVKSRAGRICIGWKKFASDNQLNVGDVCHFELTNSQGHCLEVTISRLSEETDSPATQEAKKFSSGNPCFTVKLKSNPKGVCRPFVPKKFVRKYLRNRQIVMLQLEKKLWRVNLVGQKLLSSGWALFVKESELKDGDVCVFELINKEGAVLDVHIFKGHS